MRKRYLLLAIFTASFPLHTVDSYSDEARSKTFFSMRPQYSTCGPEHLGLYRDRMMTRDDGEWGSLQLTTFGGITSSADSMARYFLPWHKQSIIVAEGPNPDTTAAVAGIYAGGSQQFKDNDHDILAHNFGINTSDRNFASRITFAPRQKYYGCALNYKQSLSDDEDKGFWVDATMPIVHVINEMRLSEAMLTTSANVAPLTGTPANMKAALNQSAWKYGKVSPTALSKTGVADFEIRIGRDSIRNEFLYRNMFFGILFPSGTTPTAEYVFEPVIGSNKHWGLVWGGSFGYRLWNNDTSSIWVVGDHKSQYLFENTQKRSFDLKDKQWSRYINLFTDSQATATTAGINILTKDMKIRAGSSFQTGTTFIFNHKRFRGEIGMQSYYKQHEDGELVDAWVENAAIAGVNAAQGATAAQSMSLADMRMWDYGIISHDVNLGALAVDVANNEARYTPIKETDLDLKSALHPATIMTTIFVSLGCHWDDQKYPPFVGMGGSYEFSRSNTGASRWKLWGKFGISV